jgi:TIR domain
MSDVFISYSKADRPLALKLSAFLEAEGWSVWWDKSLGAADLYRDEIMKQLAAARAVITIWSPNGIKSDWVRAEAGRAKVDGKLIPVKTPDVAYADIPLPFGEMHTENVGSTDLIRAAVVAQLAKPALPVSQFWQITSTFKYQILTWIGIVGSAITLFANLDGVLNLADWARELVAHWHEWTQMIWGWVFSLIGLRVPRELVSIISFIAFVGLLITGVNLSARTVQTPDELQRAIPWMRKVKLLILGILLYLAAVVAIVCLVVLLLDFIPEWFAEKPVLVVPVFGVPLAYLLYLVEERSWLVVNSLLFLLIAGCLLMPLLIGLNVTSEQEMYVMYVTSFSIFTLLQLCWMAVILFSPVQQLTRRLGFAVLGILTLVVLSEISKLNLHQYLQPPKVSDNSVR